MKSGLLVYGSCAAHHSGVGEVALGMSWRRDLAGTVRWLSAGALGGLVAGLVVGGVGGRVAMLALRLTSDPALRGLETDDGFVIGRFSGDTFFLLIFATFVGLLGGLCYLLVRSLVPLRLRPGLTGIFGGIVGGALVISPGGIDFTRLEPLSLAITLFVALPALYGVGMSLLVERLLGKDSVLNRAGAWSWGVVVLALVPIALTGPFGLILVLTVAIVWLLGRAFPKLASIWSFVPAMWIGRVILAGLTGAALVELIGDIETII
jgi:hypothetical protein